ncbi:hypothetical protein [Amycolatopsis sp. NPDC098790]
MIIDFADVASAPQVGFRLLALDQVLPLYPDRAEAEKWLSLPGSLH